MLKNKNFKFRNILVIVLLITINFLPFISLNADADSITGWAVFANNGKVYRCSVGGVPEQLYSGSVAHACWSSDGSYIYFIKTNGDICVMDNDGSDPTVLRTDTNNMAKCPIAPYRPNPNYVLYVENDKFYMISRTTGGKVQIHDDTRTYDGEIAINTAGTRMAARDGDDICKIEVGGSTTVYAPRCSSSISPNGNYLTKNWPGHTHMSIYTWDVYYPNTAYADIYTPSGIHFDNQKFVVNSDDYVVYKIDSGATAIGLVRVSDGTHWQIGNLNAEHPDFFLGSLPSTGPSAPTITTTPVTNGIGGVLYQYDVSATGSPTPTYSLDTSPAGMTINPTSGLIQWTPSSSGDYNVKVNATNANGHDTQEFILSVSVGGSTCSAGINAITGTTATGNAGTLQTVTLCGNTYDVGDGDFITGATQRYDSGDNVVNPSPYLSEYADDFSFADCTTLDASTGASYLETIFSELTYTFIIYENGDTSDDGDIQGIDSDDNLVGSPTRFNPGDYYDTGYISGTLSQPVKGFAYTFTEPVKGIRISDATGLDPLVIIALVETATEAPTITSTPQTTAPIFQSYSYDVNATGAPIPIYTLTQWPSEMTIDPNTGLISWYPDTVGNFDVTVVASNGVAPDANQTFTITVVNQSETCPDGMVHYWKLDETSTSTYIDSIGSADMSCTNCPTWTSGKVDNCQDFDSTSTERLYTDPVSNPTSEITVMAWVRPDDLTSPDKGIITKENSFLLEIESDGAELSFSRYQGGSFSECEPTVSVFTEGVWTHVAATWDGSVSRVYVNGSEIGNGDYADGPINDNTNPYYVGFSTHNPERYFDGCIDEVAVFDRALEETEIQQLYNKGLTGEGYCEPGGLSPPSIITSPITSATLGLSYSYNVDAIGNPSPTYALDLSPAGMTIGLSSGLVEWTPTSAGTFDVIVNASNSEGWDTQSFTINVVQQSGPGCPSDMIAYWKLDETASGIYVDSFGDNDGVCAGTCPDTLADGKINGGQRFERSSQTGIDIPVNATFNWGSGDSFSMEFWMKRNGPIGGTVTNDNEVILGRDDSSTSLHWWFGIKHGTGASHFQIGDKSGNYVAIEGPAVDDSKWHHLVGIRDGNNNKNILYVDGKEVANVSKTYSSGFDSATAPLNIGWLNLPGYFHYTGDLDEVALYNRVLSENEIRTHYYLARGYCEACDTDVKIMPLGDSITLGHASGVDDDDKKISYRKDLWDNLSAAGYSIDFVGSLTNGEFYESEGFDPDHEGHGGWTDSQIATNIYNNGGSNWISTYNPDVILLHIGTNGLNSNPGDVEDILDEIDEYEADNDVDVTVVLARIINRISHSTTTTDFNDNVEEMARDRVGNSSNPAYPDKIVFVDMEDGAGIIYDYTYNGGDMWDNLHPFETGYSKMASVWYDALIDFLPVCQLNPSVPVITSTPITTAFIGHPYSYDVVATGYPTPTYSLDTHPTGMTINPTSGLIQWTPGSLGSFNVNVNASNSEGYDNQDFSITVSEAPPCPTGMISYWKFDETSGSSFEDCVDGNDAGCSGGNCPSFETGIVGGALDFDGTSEYVTVPDDNSLDWGNSDSFTIELWAKFTNCNTKNKVMIGRDDRPKPGVHWWLGGHSGTKKAIFVMYSDDYPPDDGASVQGTTTINDNVWHHIVATRNASANTISIYVDGDWEGTTSHTYVGGFGATTTLGIGYMAYSGTPDYYYDGLLDEIALYSRVLTDTEIEQHYDNGLLGLGYCEGSGIAPTITSSPDTTAVVDQLYDYDVDATGDPTPTYSLDTHPTGMTINPTSGLIEWTPTIGQVGLHPIKVNASNSKGWDTQSFSIEVFESAVHGDANGDGFVDAIDITYVELIILGLRDPTPGADANEDGFIDAIDITKTELIIIGA